jgi:hypothetical protein
MRGKPYYFGGNMNKVKIILVAAACAFAIAAIAQDTNSLRTQIGLFEARPNAVILKGIGPVGSVQLGFGQLSVGYKQTKDINSGEKIHGLIIEVEGSQFASEAALVDDDEVDSLLNAINYLAKVNSDATSLPGFEASYMTKAGLRIIAESVRKDGAVLNYVQFEPYPRIALSPVQMTQFAALIQQAQKNLDALKAGK